MRNLEVWQAVSGVQALQILGEKKPNLILLDIMMPDMDGFEVCRRIKAMPGHADIPIVFLTVRDQQEDRQRAKDCGAAGYLTKPFDPFRMGEEVERYLKLENPSIGE
jgi:putative two-component system response regulator